MKRFKAAKTEGANTALNISKDVLKHVISLLDVVSVVRLCSACRELANQRDEFLEQKRQQRYNVLVELSEGVISIEKLHMISKAAERHLGAFRVHFGGIPWALRLLFEFAGFIHAKFGTDVAFFSGFELIGDEPPPEDDWADMCSSYFDDGSKALHEICPFASTGDGGILGLWNPNLIFDDVDEMPVALMDSEGGGNVACLSIVECFSVVAQQFGQEYGDFYLTPNEFAEAREEAEEMLDDSEESGWARAAFAKWLKLCFGVDPCPDPGALQSVAQGTLLSFDKWMEDCSNLLSF